MGRWCPEFTIRSENPANPRSPSVVRNIKRGAEEQIRLKSPDKFVAKVKYGPSVYASTPMPLRKALERNPKQQLHVSNLMAAPQGEAIVPIIGLDLRPEDRLRGGSTHSED